MAATIFGEMKKYPIVFIGSGISKRYLDNFPNWNDLLESYWNQINQQRGYYNYLNSLQKEYKKTYSGDELTHKINTVAAEFIEDKYNTMFNDGELSINGLTPEIVYKNNISPFKYSICQRFSECNIRDDVDKEELKFFKEFLKKAKIIITTNYDPFIEKLLQEENIELQKYIGNKGFFDATIGWAELYKIHGDVTDPDSIIINQNDYEKYDKNSVLISAKILSNLINTPIIFLGYSLTDRNIKKLLSDFSSQFPREDDRKSAERIIVIQYEKDNLNINPVYSSNDLKIPYIEIKTDNYKKIFQDISTINEGLTPYEVLRYQRVIRDLIVTEGSKGNLDKILVSPSDIENLEKNIIKGKNLVVAIGDKALILAHVDQGLYIEDYIQENDQIALELAIDVLTKNSNSCWIPFAKQIKKLRLKQITLDKSIKDKLNQRIQNQGSLDKIINSINIDKINNGKIFNSIMDIKNGNFGLNKEAKIIIKNIKNIPLDEVDNYIKTIGIEEFKKIQGNGKTELRKLFCAYDLMVNGDIEPIK
ncbi:SIR2 family protein [Orbaceae bacterium ac157xtp]